MWGSREHGYLSGEMNGVRLACGGRGADKRVERVVDLPEGVLELRVTWQLPHEAVIPAQGLRGKGGGWVGGW